MFLSKGKMFILWGTIFGLLLIILALSFDGSGLVLFSNEKSINTEKKEVIGVEKIQTETEAETKTVSERKKIILCISGEVLKPGVYELREGARVVDLIQCAGGVTKKGDLREVNQAEILMDGEMIFIPGVDGTGSAGTDGKPVPSGSGNGKGQKVSINKGSIEALDTLPGIGRATAEKIIDYRKKNGGFKNLDDLKKVPGIGEAKYKRIKDLIKM